MEYIDFAAGRKELKNVQEVKLVKAASSETPRCNAVMPICEDTCLCVFVVMCFLLCRVVPA